MKKIACIAAIVLFLAIPLSANAVLLGFGDLNVSSSTPYDTYYLDYDGQVVSSNFGYTTGIEEVFCVSKDNGNGGNYDFYEIKPDLDLLVVADSYEKLTKSVWVANNWTMWGNTDFEKGEAQKAVWKIRDVIDLVYGSGDDLLMYNAALAAYAAGYQPKGWYYAQSPSTQSEGFNYQDFITPYQVPEPTTLLLLGLGLLGITGIRRFKRN